MKEETTLLLEKEVEASTEKKVKKIVIEKKNKESLKTLFSSQEPDSSKVIEKPNFDKIDELPQEKRSKIFKLKRTERTSTKTNKKLKVALLGLAFCILVAFCITTTINIVKVNSRLEGLQNSYNASLSDLIQKIYSTETGNRSLNLFETFPEEDLTASSIYESSNWFDRFCNFLTGLFGGWFAKTFHSSFITKEDIGNISANILSFLCAYCQTFCSSNN